MEPRSSLFPRVAARCAAGLVGSIGLAVLAAWDFRIELVKTGLPGLPVMLPWTAVSISLGALALWLAASSRRQVRVASVIPAFMVAAATSLQALERGTGRDLGMDRLWFPREITVDAARLGVAPGRMGQAALVAILALALAWLIAPIMRGVLGRVLFSAFSTIGLATALISLFGYALNLRLLDDAFLDGRLALHTALSVAILAAGTLALRSEVGWVRSATELGLAGWSAAGLLGTAALLLLIGSDSDNRAGQLASNASQARLRLEVLISTLKDAETGQRGYLLTDNQSYLEPYEMARARLPRDLDGLGVLLSGDPGSDAALRRLPNLVAAKMAELAATIALHRSGDRLGTLAVVATDRGKAIMDEIRREVGSMTMVHSRIAEASAREARRARSLAFAGTFGLTVVAFWSLATAVRVRRAASRALVEREMQQRELIDTVNLGTFITRDLDGAIQYWSGGCTSLYGWTSAEAVGHRLHELLRTEFPVPLAEIEATLDCKGEWIGDLRQVARDGRDLVVTARKNLHVDARTNARVVLEMVTDVTAQRLAEHSYRDSQALLRTVIETAPGPIYATDREGCMVLANGHALAMMGRPWNEIEGRTALEFLGDAAQAGAVMANEQRIMEAGRPETIEEVLGGAENGDDRVWLSTKTPMSGAEGQVTGLVGVSVEITELKRVEDRLRLMVAELNHRVKNTLATVQGIASQTLRGADPGIYKKLEGRLGALAAAHDILTRENWEGANMHDVLEAMLRPHGGSERVRFRIEGPPLRLQPRAAVALAMGLQELVTNALKHGALSIPSGYVSIHWEISQNDRPCLHLVWSERNGPPAAAPVVRGFGSRLVERGLAQDLGGAVHLAFLPEGLACTIDAPLHEVAVQAEIMAFPRVGRVN